MQHTREENIIVGSSSASFNPLLIRVDVKDTMSLASLLEETVSAESEAEGQEVPFDELIRALQHSGEDPSDKFQVRLFVFCILFLSLFI